MREHSASATARAIAAATVLAARDPSLAPLVPSTAASWSERFLMHAPGGRLLLRSIGTGIGRWAWRALEGVVQPGIVRHWLARKRWIESRVRSAIETGTSRVVILAAGLDTLGVRCAAAYPAMQVIEVDHPATQAVKRRALGADSRVRLLPCDLAREGLPDALLEDEAPTIVLIEGVLMYLDEAAVRSLLVGMLDLTASRLGMIASFMIASAGRPIAFEPRRPVVDWWLALVREPFRSALRPDQAGEFLGSLANHRHRWRLTAHADAATLRALGGEGRMARGEEVFACERAPRPCPCPCP